MLGLRVGGLGFLALLVGCGADDFRSSGGASSSSGAGAAASSASTGSSGGDGAGGGAGGAGATGGAPVECASDAVCVPDVPADWEGPVVVYVGTDPPPRACEAPWVTAFAANLGMLEAPVPECSACACAAPTGVTCPTATVGVYANGNCTGGATETHQLGSACTAFSGGYGAISTPVTPSGGSCAPSGGTATLSSPTWEQNALVCEGAPLGDACPTGHCLPLPSAPFGPTLCIVADGDLPCPTVFTERTVVFRDVVDTRGCSACACAAPIQTSCNDAITVWGDGACTTGPVHIIGDGTCKNGIYALGMTFDAAAVGGTCDVSGGGQAQGDVQPASPVTVCCTPG